MYYKHEKFNSKLCPSQRQIAAMQDWVQDKEERLQRRFARFKAQVEKYWQRYPWMMVVVVVVVVVLTSCRSQQYIVPNDTITTTTTKTTTFERDSIYLHDSIYVREYIQGDTVYRDKLVEHYKDRWHILKDTVLQKDTTTVYQPVEVLKEVKHVPAFYKWCTAILILIILAFILKIIIKYIK